MRLGNVSHGHGLGTKLKLAVMGLVMGGSAPDVVKTVSYRPAFFGKPMNRIFQAAMRGPSEWTVGERELFAAFVSSRNQCVF